MPGIEPSTWLACVGINPSCSNSEDLWVRSGEPLKVIAESFVDMLFIFPVSGGRSVNFPKTLNIHRDGTVKLFGEAEAVITEVTSSSSWA